MPEGKLIVARNGKYTKYYISNGHKSTYLKRTDKKLKEKLAYKKYLQLRIELLKNQYNYWKSFKDNSSNLNSNIIEYLNNPGVEQLLSSYCIQPNTSYEQWMHEEFISNPKHPENLTHKSINGLYCRSKSESLIAIALTNHGIPFRYECIFENDKFDYYPDFTTIHPITGKTIYWEHFGRLDLPSYIEEMRQKLLLLSSHNIIYGENLILTFETSDAQISYGTIEKMIQLYYYD